MLTLNIEHLFPNKILHSWTHDGTYYCVTLFGEIFGSNNKFKHTSYKIGKLPLDFNLVSIITNSKRILETGNTSTDNTLISLQVCENILLAQYYTTDGTVVSYISKSYGVTWNQLSNIPNRQTDIGSEVVWMDDTIAFIIKDSTDNDCYIFKPVFKQREIDTYTDLVNWFILKDDGTVINDPINNTTTDKVHINSSFKDSGQFYKEFTSDSNNMDGAHEYTRKPYILSWPTVDGWDGDLPKTLDKSGYLVNPVDPVYYKDNGSTYALVRIPMSLSVRSGTIASSNNKYLPDEYVTRVPVVLCFNVDHIAIAKPNTPLQIKVLDIYGIDQRLAPLHSAYYTTRSGIYSFLEGLTVDSYGFLKEYGKLGTIYDYDVNGNGNGLYNTVTNDDFKHMCTGELFKITDPKTGMDVVSLIGKGRIYVCTGDPSKELNWEDKTKASTFKTPTQNSYTRARESVVDSSIDNYVSVDVKQWCHFQSVLRYNIDKNRLIGFPVSTDNDPLDYESIVGYKFPIYVPTAGSYTILDGLNKYTKTIVVETTEPQKLDNSFRTRENKNLYFGGFVADEAGYIGGLSGFVEGYDGGDIIDPTIIDPVVIDPGTPGNKPSVLAILDGVNKSTTANITTNRLSVTFQSGSGGCIGNIAAMSGKWYLELSNISSKSIYFGLVKSTVDINKEPGDDTAMCVIGLNGEVIVNTRIINVVDVIRQLELTNLVLGVMLDMDNRTLTVRTAQSLTTMVELPNESLYFYVGAVSNSVVENSVTVNFGQNPFTFNVPGGYMSGYGIK